MKSTSIGFVGGGRIVRIILTALQRKGGLPSQLVISDPDPDSLTAIREQFPLPGIVLTSDNTQAAKQEYVFLAVHPPAMQEVAGQVSAHISRNSFVVSLAPVFRISSISKLLGDHPKVIRMIPNALTWINRGFNPIAFSPNISTVEKEEVAELFGALGLFPEVEEEKLEAYAILSAMGPTYFWFQFNELQQLSTSFGLTPAESKAAIRETVSGAVDTLFDSGLSYKEVVDLIPVKPIDEYEAQFRDAYRTRLTELYRKLSGQL